MAARYLSTLIVSASLSLISSVVWAQTFERGVDRPGFDFRNFDIDGPARACQAACGRRDQCRAWTYVRAGFQGPAPRCWLKFRVPPATGNECCVSGIMP